MSTEQYMLHKIDEQRESRGFHRISELLRLSEQGNTFLDPFSTLISKSVVLGDNNLFYPNVTIEANRGGVIVVGNANAFYPNTYILAEEGKVSVGDDNQFGDGGCSLKANRSDAEITVGDNGRYINGAQIIGRTTLGSGSQVIGPITVQDCTLEAGEDFQSSDPDLRAGLLKGTGLARGIVVPKGKVLNGAGTFEQDSIEAQSKYHPKNK